MTANTAASSMKDSGIPWVGMIPTEWDVFPAGGVFDEVKEKNTNNKYSNPFSFRYGEIVDKKIAGDIDEGLEETLSAYRVVSPNTIMLNGLNLNYDFITQRVAIVKEKGIITSAYLAVQPDESRVVPRFMLYLLKAYDYRQVLHSIGSGIRKTLKYQDFKSIKVVAPSMAEQRRLVSYLDSECAKIDEVIAEAKVSIEDYKQWKASIIYEAVTKGLNPDVAMKDSGIYWVGLIPANWAIKKVKHCVSISNGSDPKLEGDIPVYGSGADSFKTCGEFKQGPAVLIGRKGATLHIPHYIEGRYWNVDTAFDVKSIQDFSLKYFYYLACCFDYKYYISQTTLPSMTQTSYNNMRIPVPPAETQHSISVYLDEYCATIDNFLEEREALISDLEDYKKSLIYEVVTGKRRVC